MKVTRTKLKNGLKTVIIETPDSNVVATTLFIGAGGRYENPESYGLSHFLEHMLFKGTKKYPNKEVYATAIESIGGQQNGGTDLDYTCYLNIVPKEYYALAFDSILEQVKNPLIPAEEIERDRGVIIEEGRMRSDDPSTLVWDKLTGVMWPGQPLGSDVLGPEKNLKTFQRPQFIEYMNMHYRVENMALAVAGGVKASEITPILEDIFGQLEKGQKTEPLPIVEDQTESRTALIEKNIDQANLILAYKTFPISDKRKVALDVLSSILGSGMGSILFREVREKRSLAYRIFSSAEYFSDAGVFAIYAGLNRDNVEEAIEAIKAELAKTVAAPIGEEDIKRAKEFLKGSFKISMETAGSLANWYGRKELTHPDTPDPEEIFEQIDKLSTEDLTEVAKEIFRPERENLLIVGPYKDKTKFEKALKS